MIGANICHLSWTEQTARLRVFFFIKFFYLAASIAIELSLPKNALGHQTKYFYAHARIHIFQYHYAFWLLGCCWPPQKGSIYLLTGLVFHPALLSRKDWCVYVCVCVGGGEFIWKHALYFSHKHIHTHSRMYIWWIHVFEDCIYSNIVRVSMGAHYTQIIFWRVFGDWLHYTQ